VGESYKKAHRSKVNRESKSIYLIKLRGGQKNSVRKKTGKGWGGLNRHLKLPDAEGGMSDTFGHSGREWTDEAKKEQNKKERRR